MYAVHTGAGLQRQQFADAVLVRREFPATSVEFDTTPHRRWSSSV